jgi:hypothetical protein
MLRWLAQLYSICYVCGLDQAVMFDLQHTQRIFAEVTVICQRWLVSLLTRLQKPYSPRQSYSCRCLTYECAKAMYKGQLTASSCEALGTACLS